MNVYYESNAWFLSQNELNYEQYTNLRKNLLMSLPKCLNVSECVDKRHAQNTFLKSKLFGMYKGVGGSKWCRLGLTNAQLILSLGKP